MLPSLEQVHKEKKRLTALRDQLHREATDAMWSGGGIGMSIISGQLLSGARAIGKRVDAMIELEELLLTHASIKELQERGFNSSLLALAKTLIAARIKFLASSSAFETSKEQSAITSETQTVT